MSEIVQCKKCKGRGEHRRGERCDACKGAKRVVVTTDKDGKKTITPAPEVE